jgi:stress response protein YsnF
MATTSTENKTVVGLFDDFQSAQGASERLESAGVARDNISIIAGNESGKYEQYVSGTGEVGKETGKRAATGAAIGGGLGLLAGLTALVIPGVGPIIAAGPIAAGLTGAGIGAAAGGLIGGLTSAGISETDANYYAEGVRRGGVLVMVRTTEEMADKAAEILDDAGAKDVDEKAREWRSSGWTPSGAVSSSDVRVSGQQRKSPKDVEGTQSVPVIKEELHVGKRTVERGGVRIYSRIETEPVEEQVTLRDENVTVERRPVNREATKADLGGFKEGRNDGADRNA